MEAELHRMEYFHAGMAATTAMPIAYPTSRAFPALSCSCIMAPAASVAGGLRAARLFRRGLLLRRHLFGRLVARGAQLHE